MSDKIFTENQTAFQETDIPPYPMAKLSLDLSGPYSTTMSGNKYIKAFVDWYIGWPEVFAVLDKTGETVTDLIIDQVYHARLLFTIGNR